MSSFLDDRELGQAISKLLKETGLRCAVAFWGDGAVTNLFQNGKPPTGTRIICDWTMGGTNPNELVKMGAPNNKKIKHLPGLHAKLYLSDRTAIICSANASNNGIGFLDAPNLIEIGILIGANTDTYAAAADWFDAVWKSAKLVDDSALAKAKEAWKRRKTGKISAKIGGEVNPASVLGAVIAEPERFRGVGFVFTTGNATKQQRDETTDAVIENDKKNPVRIISSGERKALPKWPISNVFSEWPADDISRWPMEFICAHWGSRAKRFSYWFYRRAHTVVIDGDRGMLLGRRNPELKRKLGFKAGRQKMAEVDEEDISRIFGYVEKTDHRLFANGAELVEFIAKLPP
jgi:hypothetical protein